MLFNYDNINICSLIHSCPVFSYDKNQQNYLYVKNPLNDKGNDITISFRS